MPSYLGDSLCPTDNVASSPREAGGTCSPPVTQPRGCGRVQQGHASPNAGLDLRGSDTGLYCRGHVFDLVLVFAERMEFYMNTGS